ncbi:MAG: hypothetical protein ACRCW0_03025 [Clostridium sp.]
MSSFEDLVKSIFDISDKNINEIEKEIEKNEFDLLSFIGLILLTYNIEKDYLKLTNSERNYLSEKAANKTIDLFDKATKFETKKTFETLKRTSKKSAIYCDLVFGTGFETNSNKEDLVNSFAKQFIDKKYKGEKFSKRIWDNNNQISKEIQNEIDKLLNGQTSVNQIKKNIENKFNTSKFNASRLVDSEVARVHDQTFKKFCKDYEINEVIYKATFCNTCTECKKDHNKKFKLEDAPQLPRHPQCHCYYTYDLDNKSKDTTIDLQLFSRIKDKENLEDMINSGAVSQKDFNSFQSSFRTKFKDGIDTPLGKIRNNAKREYHIAYRHSDLVSEVGVKRIHDTLNKPDCIRKAIDSNGIQSKGYIKKFGNRTLLVIAKNDIITAYYPGRNYLKNRVESWDILWEEK